MPLPAHIAFFQGKHEVTVCMSRLYCRAGENLLATYCRLKIGWESKEQALMEKQVGTHRGSRTEKTKSNDEANAIHVE
jgi:hypothetical protein